MRRKGDPKLPKVKEEWRKDFYVRTVPKTDYLKHFRTIRYDIKRRWGLELPDLELLLFLYSEGLFTRKEFKEMTQTYSWSKTRFEKLRHAGWIHMWRPHRGREAALYEVTEKTRRVIDTFYKRLAYQMRISEEPTRNPIFKKGAGYMDKVYQRAIKRFNKEVK